MKIGFLGAGNMGGAIAKAVCAAGYAADVILCDKDESKTAALAAELGCESGAIASLTACDTVFLGVKPQYLREATAQLCTVLANRRPLLISMAAGVSLETLCALAPGYPIIRIMPNTPVGIGKGMVLYTPGNGVTKDQTDRFLDIMKRAGVLTLLPEDKIDAASAVSGCGPAFVALFIEALADGAVAAGLPRGTAITLASQTLLGTAALVMESGKHPGTLKDEVCSPGGSTIAGVQALENGAFRATVIDAVLAAFERTKELGKQ